MTRAQSLWLHPSDAPVRVALHRFAEYPWFFRFLEDRLGELPEYVTVRWLPYDDFTRLLIEADDEEHAEQIESWIEEVSGMIERGDDVPPVVRDHGDIADGRHRSFAAEGLGIQLAPTIDFADMKY